MTAARLLIAALLAGSLWCEAANGGAAEAAPVSLGESLDPLVAHFNAGSGKPRVIALVSSTCPACLFGAKAVRTSVLEAYPQADLRVSIVWIDMLPSDGQKAAARSAAIFDDARVKQFHDPARAAGRAIGRDLLLEGAGPAWDIYLFYDAAAVWTDEPPEPVEWYHQLAGSKRADPARFRAGDDLPVALRDATGRLLAADPGAGACAGTFEVDVLCLPNCPNTEALCANLAEACRSLSVECRIRRIDVTTLPQDDPRRAWGSPTALHNGADLMGEPRPAGGAISCRIYPGGVPTAARLADRIRPLPRPDDAN